MRVGAIATHSGSAEVIEFFAPCNPPKTTAQTNTRIAVRGGHAVAYKGKEGREVEQLLAAVFAPHCPETPLDGPLRLDLEITWLPRSADIGTKAKSKRFENGGKIWCDTKPDWDNASKAIVDIMAKLGFLIDDKTIVFATVKKYFGLRPGIRVSLSPLCESVT